VCEVREGVISSRLSVNWDVVLKLLPPLLGWPVLSILPQIMFFKWAFNTCDYVVTGRDEGVV